MRKNKKAKNDYKEERFRYCLYGKEIRSQRYRLDRGSQPGGYLYDILREHGGLVQTHSYKDDVFEKVDVGPGRYYPKYQNRKRVILGKVYPPKDSHRENIYCSECLGYCGFHLPSCSKYEKKTKSNIAKIANKKIMEVEGLKK